MTRFEDLAAAIVHVHATGQTGIEASNRPHDVDALELIPAVFLEDRRVLHGILVGTWRAVGITRIGVPWRRRIRVIVGDLAFTGDDVMGKHAANGLVET